MLFVRQDVIRGVLIKKINTIHQNKKLIRLKLPNDLILLVKMLSMCIIYKCANVLQVFLDILTPMIDTLTDPQLLRRCLRGATQNANESINSVVWSILSKTKYHGYHTVRGAAAIATIFFNRGRSGLVKFFDEVQIPVTEQLLDAILEKDCVRIETAERNTQQFETIRRRKEQQRMVAEIEEDQMDYSAGMF